MIKNFSYINCKYIRGGTSKGVFIEDEDLNRIANTQEEKENIIFKLLGSPDPYNLQMDGLGGGISSNSKVVILSKKEIDNKIYLNYNFGQVSVKEKKIDFSGTCGNLASGLFEYCKYTDKYNECIENNNQFEKEKYNKVLNVWSENKKNKMAIYGNIYLKKEEKNNSNLIEISGVPGKSDPIYVTFLYNKHNLLPTGNHIDYFEDIKYTLINGANPIIFTDLNDFKRKLKKENIELFKLQYSDVNEIIDSIKKHVSEKYKIKLTDSFRISIVDKSNNDENDIRAIITAPGNPGRFHHAMTGTGALNISFCSEINGSIVNNLLKLKQINSSIIRIQHPSGYFDCSHKILKENNNYLALQGGFLRTSRILIEGKAYL